MCAIALNTPATMASFNEQVYGLVRRVPEGRVITYGSIARLLGDPRKAREVGWAMAVCPEDVPAHRVINRFGGVSGDASSTEAAHRRSMLEVEGVLFDPRGRCDLSVYEWLPSNGKVTDA
jgi:methylated-DNA-protein-cysteine methyltransferase-like protein